MAVVCRVAAELLLFAANTTDMQIRFDDNFSANHHLPRPMDWKQQTIEMFCSRSSKCATVLPAALYSQSLTQWFPHPLSQSVSKSGSHRANMTQQFHPTNRWFCAFCAIRHRHATVNTSCKWPTEGIGTPQNGRQNVTLSVYDRKATTEAIVQNCYHHPAAISCPCSERESEMTAKPPSDSQ